MYCPPPTNAQFTDFFGTPRKMNSYEWRYFSSDDDAAFIKKLLSDIPGVSNVTLYDGANGPVPGGLDVTQTLIGADTPTVVYGDDGRKVNKFVMDYEDPTGAIPSGKLQCNVGLLLYNRGVGFPSFNMGNMPPYTKLCITKLPDDIEVCWTH